MKIPYYIFDKKLFSSFIKKYSNYGKIFYPIKANDHPLIISEIIKNNCGFEIDSIEHMRELIKCGVSPEEMCYSYPIKEIDDAKEALMLGVRLFVVDSFEEYEKILCLSTNAKFVVRINISDILNANLRPEQNKWGLSLDDASRLISRIKIENQILVGLSFYITAELHQEDILGKVLNIITEKFINIGVEFINIGGGISLDELKINQLNLEKAKKAVGANYIVLEPGRHLLDPCIDMIVSVTAVRNINSNRLVFVNAGIYSGLLDAIIKHKKYHIEDEQQNPTSTLANVFVCGSSSDISDVLGEYRLRDNLVAGDNLIFKDCGSYSAVMQTCFYRKEHAEMILKIN